MVHVLHADRPDRWSHPARGAWIEIFLQSAWPGTRSRRTPHGVRGLKLHRRVCVCPRARRTPHGVRGLKYRAQASVGGRPRSHPARGAWIEICASFYAKRTQKRRTPHGVRGLKSLEHDATQPSPRSEPPPKSRRPGLQMQSGASNIKGRHICRKDGMGSARPPSRNGGRGTMKDRNETSGPARFS